MEAKLGAGPCDMAGARNSAASTRNNLWARSQRLLSIPQHQECTSGRHGSTLTKGGPMSAWLAVATSLGPWQRQQRAVLRQNALLQRLGHDDRFPRLRKGVCEKGGSCRAWCASIDIFVRLRWLDSPFSRLASTMQTRSWGCY